MVTARGRRCGSIAGRRDGDQGEDIDRLRVGRRSLVVAAVAVLLVTTVGCSSQGGEGLTAWSDTWDEARGLVPERTALGSADRRDEVCSDTLGQLREIAPALREVPDPALEPPVQAWIADAESMFFECFEGRTPEEVDAEFRELHVLGTEIDAALEDLAG